MRSFGSSSSSPSSGSRTGPGRPRRAAAWLIDIAAENAGGALHGTVMIGVLLAAEDAGSEGYPATIGAAAIVLTLYWLMSLYTHTLGMRLRTGEPLDRVLLWRSCTHELPIIEGGVLPVIALIVAWAAGGTVTSGVTAALWTAALSIVALELAAGRRARLSRRALCLQTGISAVMGLAILALKLVLH